MSRDSVGKVGRKKYGHTSAHKQPADTPGKPNQTMIKAAQTTATAPMENPEGNSAQPAQSKKAKNAKATPAKSAAMVKTSSKQGISPAQSEKLLELAEGIRESQRSIGALSKTAKEKIAETMEVVRFGKMLSECKTIVGHGGWLKWLDENCKMSIGTAQAYMRVSRGALPNNQRADYLEEPKSIRQAIALLSEDEKKSRPTKEKAGAEAEADDGEEALRRISLLATRLVDALRQLPRGKENDAFEGLSKVRGWINSASIPAPSTPVS